MSMPSSRRSRCPFELELQDAMIHHQLQDVRPSSPLLDVVSPRMTQGCPYPPRTRHLLGRDLRMSNFELELGRKAARIRPKRRTRTCNADGLLMTAAFLLPTVIKTALRGVYLLGPPLFLELPPNKNELRGVYTSGDVTDLRISTKPNSSFSSSSTKNTSLTTSLKHNPAHTNYSFLARGTSNSSFLKDFNTYAV